MAKRDDVIERKFNEWWQRFTRKNGDRLPTLHESFVAGFKAARDIWQDAALNAAPRHFTQDDTNGD